MSSDFKKALTALVLTLVGGTLLDFRLAAAGAQARASDVQRTEHELRVCADPNNLPFSNERGQGFENRLAELVAEDLGRKLQYTWWPQRRGFIRNTLDAGACDVVMGVPSNYNLALPTAAYYRSSYVFVTRRDRGLHLASLDDPQLHLLHIGIEANVPPAHALAARELQTNVRGYNVYSDYFLIERTASGIPTRTAGDNVEQAPHFLSVWLTRRSYSTRCLSRTFALVKRWGRSPLR